ncbi:hypothetical protein NMG60_11007891 [Bertholletia excelsa]
MRILCDACEKAAAVLFCAADEAALCRSCDNKVHTCNKLANRHVRVWFADPSDIPRCDICENAPAFFYCEVDGSSLCLQCDMIAHVGGKRSHRRYLVLRQRIEFPGDKPGHLADPAFPGYKPGHLEDPASKLLGQNHRDLSVLKSDAKADGHSKIETNIIDLNMNPYRIHEQASQNQEL